MLAEELFAKALRSFETCVSVNKNLCGLESPKLLDETVKVISVSFFIPVFN